MFSAQSWGYKLKFISEIDLDCKIRLFQVKTMIHHLKNQPVQRTLYMREQKWSGLFKSNAISNLNFWWVGALYNQLEHCNS